MGSPQCSLRAIRRCAYNGAPTANGALPHSCTDSAGNTGGDTFHFKFDDTLPSASAAPDRGPNANGWYTRPVTITFSGSDDVSAVTCAPATFTYSGPDRAAAPVSASMH